ncbi:ComEC/Rec2 family competence protein [Leifsonia sp. NPDC058230]|uniref:ComEC/Rec2 family competence protein n=1 Tax=Leifsonia sp. NPDC058230 TaxID=3346391 RepID=UPI0036D9C327
MTFDLRLVVPAVAIWLVCGVAVAFPDVVSRMAPVAWVIAALCAVAAIAAGRRRGSTDGRDRRAGRGGAHWARLDRARRALRIGWMSAALSIIGAAGALGSVATDAPRRTPAAVSEAARAGSAITVVVRTDSAPQSIRAGFDGQARWMWRGTALSATVADDRFAVDMPVSVIATTSASDVRRIVFGSVTVVEATLRPTEPGEATGFIAVARGAPRVSANPPLWLGWTARIRERLAAGAALTPGDGGALLPGLSIGDVTAVGEQLDEDMKASSLSHLTAVSGANCALVTGLVFFGGSLVGLGRRGRVAAALVALVAFVVLVTPGASVIRAATMAVVVLIAVARGRPAQGLPVLALAVIVLLLHDPWLARNYGFALSVLATAGLLVLARPLARVLTRWMPRALATVVSIPLAAQVMCQPVLLMLAPTLPLYGVGANLLAEPAAPLATVLGLVACVLLPVAPVLGQAVVWVAWIPAAWIAQVAHTASSLPGSSLPWLDGPVGVALCACAVAAIAVLVLSPSGPPRGVLATIAGGALIAGVGVYSGSLGGGALGRVLSIPPDWQIAACDVGQGDGVLVRDGDRVAMIDVGREPGPAKDCLERLGVERLELLILTHFDADHVGGLAAVVGSTRAVVVGQTGREADERVIAELRRAGVEIIQGFAGRTGRLGELEWRILWPPAPEPGEPAIGENDGSVTVAMEGRGLRSIYLGDLGENAQNELLATGQVAPVDVVKVAHHGSADQSEALYERLRATVGLVSAGVDNGYGHPTQRALQLLSRNGTVAERTDTQGMILVSPGTAQGGVRVWSERRAAGESTASKHPGGDGGPPYAGEDRGGTWRHDPAARRAGARERRRPSRSRSSRGTRSGPPRWSWSRVRKAFSPTVRSVRCATASRRRIRVSRSATSPPTTTPRANC